MRAGEVGVTLQIETGFDLTGATGVVLHIRQPSNGPKVERTITPPGSGTSVSYTTVAADFPVGGVYELELQVTGTAPVKDLRSQRGKIEVAPSLVLVAP